MLKHRLGYLELVAAAPVPLAHGHQHLCPAEPHRLREKPPQTDPNLLGAVRGVLGRRRKWGQLEVWPCRANNWRTALGRNQSSQHSLVWCRSFARAETAT